MSGPVFLIVYAALAIAANAGLRGYLRWRESSRPMAFMQFAQDPYRVAYLRNGAGEAARLAVFSLVDRGLLAEDEGKVQRTHAEASTHARRPIEKAVLSCCDNPLAFDCIEHRAGIQVACEAYEDELDKLGLVAGPRTLAARFVPFVATLAMVVGVALARIKWALDHGHQNILILVAFTVIAGIGLAAARRQRETGLGIVALNRLTVLFAMLKRNAADLVPGGKTNQAVLTAAIFGMGILPAAQFPYLRRLFPPSRSRGGNGDGGGGDSGSGGSDGASGCGGGGCGGGCGGCGG